MNYADALNYSHSLRTRAPTVSCLYHPNGHIKYAQDSSSIVNEVIYQTNLTSEVHKYLQLHFTVGFSVRKQFLAHSRSDDPFAWQMHWRLHGRCSIR